MTSTLTITALDAVRSGQCTANCLLAASAANTCDCRCNGAFHGAVAYIEVAIPDDATTMRRTTCGARPPEKPVYSIPPGDWLPIDLGGCDLPAGHPPLPARYEHHNGGDYGPSVWYEPVETPPADDCESCNHTGIGAGPCNPPHCPFETVHRRREAVP